MSQHQRGVNTVGFVLLRAGRLLLSPPALFLSDALARPVHQLHVQTGSSLPAHEECPCDASCTVCVPCPAMSALCRTLDKVSRSAEKRCEKQMISCALRRWHLRPIVSFFVLVRPMRLESIGSRLDFTSLRKELLVSVGGASVLS